MSDSIAEQLKPFQDAMRSGRPEVKPVVQVTCEISAKSPIQASVAAKTELLNWLRDKQRIRDIPASAWNGEPFEIDEPPDSSVAVEAYENLWALRYNKPDSELRGRVWRTEAIVGVQGDIALLGVRLTVITRDWEVPFFRSVPRVILDLAEELELVDYGVKLTATPLIVDNAHQVRELVDLLELPTRTRPVFVISRGFEADLVVDPSYLAQRTAGIAHVAVIDKDAAWLLSEALGSELSVYGDALRTYKPGFDRFDARWDDHPLATREWLRGKFEKRSVFTNMLVESAIRNSVALPNLEHRVPTFSRVRQVLAKRRMAAALQANVSGAEMLRIYEEDNKRLQMDLDAAEYLLEEKEQLQRTVGDERDQIARQNFSLRVRIQQLETSRTRDDASEAIEWPSGYEALDGWVGRYLGDRVVLLPRAARAAKKAEFQDIVLVAQALLLLGNEYRQLRMGTGNREGFEAAADRLGIALSGSGSEASLMQWREEYEVTWGRTKRFLDMHLKRGKSREPKNCLRIYFFWDEDSQQVVVGHLPSHLTNDMT